MPSLVLKMSDCFRGAAFGESPSRERAIPGRRPTPSATFEAIDAVHNAPACRPRNAAIADAHRNDMSWHEIEIAAIEPAGENSSKPDIDAQPGRRLLPFTLR
jgi:hypothetical protein